MVQSSPTVSSFLSRSNRIRLRVLSARTLNRSRTGVGIYPSIWIDGNTTRLATQERDCPSPRPADARVHGCPIPILFRLSKRHRGEHCPDRIAHAIDVGLRRRPVITQDAELEQVLVRRGDEA